MSDLLALLDALDGLHKAATSGEWIDMGDTEPWPGAVIATDGIGVTPVCIDPEADDRPADRACISALHNAYPRLAQALRAALPFTTRTGQPTAATNSPMLMSLRFARWPHPVRRTAVSPMRTRSV